ncbi:MAG: hypothetical protein R2850_10265 [Bacteroidia bacterium]
MRVKIFLLQFLVFGCSVQAQSLYDQEHSESFASYLYASGNYKLAAIEFERLLFNNPANDSLRQRLIKSMLLDENFEGALDRTIHFNIPSQEFSPQLASLYSYGLISYGNQQGARAFLQINNNLESKEQTYFKAYSYLLETDFKSAQTLQSTSENMLSPELNELINETRNLKHKSPALAACMSAIVPGTGKFYTGDWKDAIIGMLAIGLTGYQAYRGFNRNGINSGYGWIYGSIAAGFYLGNVYGSATSAKRFNKRQTDKIEERIRHTFMLRP